jgi:serine/threonine-protein kinase
MQSRVVAKVIHSELVPDKKAVDRFRLEAQALAQLDHPNVVEIFGTGATSDGRPYIVLEYLQGETLSTRLRREKVDVATAIDYAVQYLSALEAAHRAGIVHRDLKPGNILLARDLEGKILIKVLDFGLAKVLPDAPTDAPSPLADPTTLGTALGTPSYMSPEQALGRDVDERGDIYAAAVVLYKSLTGVGPFEHLGRERQMDAHVQETPLPPSEFMGERINAELDQAVLKALSKDPAERYYSAAEFRDVLIACRKRPVQSAENGEKVERGRVGKATGLFLAALLVSAGVSIVVQALFF